MKVDAPPWTMPTRTGAAAFWARTRVLAALRRVRGWHRPGVRRWQADAALSSAPICARQRTPLWSDAAPGEFTLTAGKVHNLRLAAAAFNGVVIPAGERLSFWRQLGRPSERRGFVRGRELRAGCVIPTIAGGICQISNALATCAARAGFELVERHGHTARVGVSTLSGDSLDATVFWSHVDLQIRAPVAWRLELELTAEELVLTIRALGPSPSGARAVFEPARPANLVIRSCLSCDETSCFRHRPASRSVEARGAWLLDGWTPEFFRWLAGRGGIADRVLPVPPREFHRWLLRSRTASSGKGWDALARPDGAAVERFGWTCFWRALSLRRHASHAGRRQAGVIDGRRRLALAYARRLRPEHVDLVIDQGLLPHLHQQGVLGGRSYDVLADALPMDEIQRRLDLACESADSDQRGDATLSDFRAAESLVQAEIAAIRGARRLLTAHTEVAAHWRQRVPALEVRCLPWELPTSMGVRHPDALPLVVFPASALARKGAGELAAALRGLPCRLRVLGSASDDPWLWRGMQVEQGRYRDDWASRAAIVVLPAHVEHAPRMLLKAIAAGIPVVATPACGVSGMAGVHLVPAGDVEALRAVLQVLCQNAQAIDADELRGPAATMRSPESLAVTHA